MTRASRPIPSFRFTAQLPGDKSITHRAFILGALAKGESRIRGANPGADCRATLAALRALGAESDEDGDTIRIRGMAGAFRAPGAPLDLGNSGTGLRLLLGVLAAQPFTVTVTGDASLSRRPVERVLEPLRRMGAEAEAPGDHPPVTLSGRPLQAIDYTLPVPSAQVKSALLLAGVQATGVTRVRGSGASRDHTERLLPVFGVPVATGPDGIEVEGPAGLRAADLEIPKDPSAATFFLTAAALVPGSEVICEGISLNPLRIQALEVFRRMGLEVETTSGPEAAEPRGTVTARSGELRALTLDPPEIPALIDELPALAVAAAWARGRSRIRGAGELRHKESDRLHTVAAGLAAIGARVVEHPDGWEIEGSGGEPLPGGTVDAAGDHRVAMAFLVAGLRCRDGVRLSGEDGIATSDPDFPETLERLMEAAR